MNWHRSPSTIGSFNSHTKLWENMKQVLLDGWCIEWMHLKLCVISGIDLFGNHSALEPGLSACQKGLLFNTSK